MSPAQWLLAAAMRVVGAVLARMPPSADLRLGAWLARRRIGTVRKRRRVVVRNLALCFPELPAPERAALADAALASNLAGVFDTLRAATAPDRCLRGQAEVRGLEHLHAALAQGRGVVLLGAHCDCLDLAFRHLRLAAGVPLGLVGRGFNLQGADRVIQNGRDRHLGHLFRKKKIGDFCRWVQAGHPAIYLADLNVSERVVFAPFFGVPAATLDAIGGVLGRAGGAVLPLWAWRGDDGRLVVEVQPAWPEDFAAAPPPQVARRYMGWVEAQVRRHPAQYLWTHRRFKTRPEGEPPLYP